MTDEMLCSSDDFESAPREKYTERVSRCSFAQKTREQKRPPLLFARASEKMCRPFPLKFGGKAIQEVATRALLSRTRQSLSHSLTHTHTRSSSSSSHSSRSSTCKTCERVANLRVFTRTQPRGERRRKARTRRRICLEGIQTYGTEYAR